MEGLYELPFMEVSDSERAAFELKQTISDLKQAVSNIKQAVFNTNQAASDIKQTASDFRQAASDIKQAASDIEQAASYIEQAASTEPLPGQWTVRSEHTIQNLVPIANTSSKDLDIACSANVKKDFLGLPLELRKMVYEILVPKDSYRNLVPARSPLPEDRDITALANTNKQVREEIHQVQSRLRSVRLIIQPNNRRQERLLYGLQKINFKHVNAVEIYFDYDINGLDIAYYDSRRKFERDSYIYAKLSDHLIDLLQVLDKDPRAKRLPPLRIRFRDEPRPSTGLISCGDPFWTMTSHQFQRTGKGDSFTTFMQQSRSTAGTVQVFAAYLLQIFTFRASRRYQFRRVEAEFLKGISILNHRSFVDFFSGIQTQMTYSPRK
ncbi:MAG: hypothetical protein M1821_004974 [Bathelium mastoideum]|nr:MAG: hypothetical protein M1821_004974 [Bathelium mastoideum]